MPGDEEANIAASRSVQITSISFLINMQREELERKLRDNEYVDEFEIEDLDDKDVRKDVFIIFKNPVDSKYVNDILKEILK